MTSYVPPIKNGASGWIGYVSLAPRTATGAWQSNPTLATGDVKISIDGGSLANLGTLPAVTPASSKLVKITLSQAETNGDNLTIIFSDAAGAEWCDLTINLQTVARQIDDLAYPATSGRSITVDASGNANTNLVNIAGSAVSTTTAQLGVNVVNAAGTAWGSGAITAASIAASALNGKGDWNIGKTGYSLTATTGLGNQTADITGSLSGSVGSVTGAVGSVTGNVGGNVTGSVGSIATGGIAATSFAAGAINATAIAADAITAAKVAADVTTEIQSGLATAASIAALNNLSQADIRTAVGLASANLDTQLTAIDDYLDTEVAAIKAKTDQLTFTVANQVDSNIQYVNDVAVTGTGAAGNEWGP